LDPRVSWRAAALVEPTAVAVRAVNRTGPRLGETALVVGAGPIGLAILQVLRAAGVDRVMVSEVARRRREMAQAFGATLALDPQAEDVTAAVSEFTNGLGVDMAFECAGTESAFHTALSSTRKGGRVCMVSQTNTPMRLYVNDLGFFERTMIGTVAYCGEFAPAIRLIAEGKVRAEEMITATIPLEDLVRVGYRELMENTGNHVKIVVSLS